MTQRPCPAPGPPRRLILTREAAGCESRPEPDRLRTRALQPLSEPPSRHLGGKGAGDQRQQRSAPRSSAPLCEVGWPHTYFSHKDEGLARRPPAGRKRRVPDPSPGDPVVGLQSGLGYAVPRAQAGGGEPGGPALPGEVEGAGPGRRPRSRGAGAEGPPGERESRLPLGWFIVASSALRTQTLRPRLQRLRCPRPDARLACPGGRMGSASRSRLLPGRQRRGRAALKGGNDTVSCLQVTFLCWTLLCFFESGKARGLGDVCAEVSTFSSGSVIAS